MACETETMFINDIEYTCTQYPAITSMKYKLKVLKLLGHAIGEILPLISKNKNSNEDQLSIISNVINKLFESTKPEDIIDLIVEMLTTGNTKRDGKRITMPLFEEVYSGDSMVEAYKAFAFVLKVNYRGFFKGQKAKELLAKVEDNL